MLWLDLGLNSGFPNHCWTLSTRPMIRYPNLGKLNKRLHKWLTFYIDMFVPIFHVRHSERDSVKAYSSIKDRRNRYKEIHETHQYSVIDTIICVVPLAAKSKCSESPRNFVKIKGTILSLSLISSHYCLIFFFVFFLNKIYWDSFLLMMWHHVGGVPGRRSLSLFWRETQTKGLNSKSPVRPEVEEERKVREKTGVIWQRNPERGSRKRTAEETSRGEIAVQGTNGQQKEAVKEDFKNELAFLVAFVEVSRKIHAHDSL